MKTIRKVSFLLATILIIFSSCSRTNKDIYKIAPEETLGVVSFHPGMLMEKANMEELGFLQKNIEDRDFFEKFLEEPENTGIETNAYSAVFAFGRKPTHFCVTMPMKNTKRFEEFLQELAVKADETIDIDELGDYEYVYHDEVFIAWNNDIAFILAGYGFGESADLRTLALRLMQLEKEESLLADRNFNNFLNRQKDINAWITSTNISDISGNNQMENLMQIFGGLKNNYGHAYLNFQDEYIRLTSNLIMNSSMKETVEKYNFLNKKAGQDLLEYLPQENLFFVTNSYVDPEKMIEFLSFINKDFERITGRISNELGLEEEELKKVFRGDMAFSINGVQETDVKSESEIYGKFSFSKSIPLFHGVATLNNPVIFNTVLGKAVEEGEISKVNDYYSINENAIPVYFMVQESVLVLSNNQKYMDLIHDQGNPENSVLDAGYANVLTQDPICFFVNLDANSNTNEFREYIRKEMDQDLATGIETFGESVKSISLTASLEEMKFTLNMTEDGENSLYTMLKQFDR